MASGGYPDCIKQLLANSDEEFSKASSILLKIVRNIQSNPTEEKYRSIQVGSRTFMDSLLPVDGAIQCLYEMGFVESDDRMVCVSESVAQLNTMKTHLENAIKEKQKQTPATTTQRVESPNTDIRNSEANTYTKIRSHFGNVLVYEDRSLQQKARSVIPTETLSKRAEERLSQTPELRSNRGMIAMSYADCLLLELLQWFKHEFFTWSDAPECPTCFSGKPISLGMLTPTTEELKWGAHSVEGYRCSQCKDTLRYPRYNHPGKLLETRTGRCGEWANCFTLMCRALDFDARHVLDWTDHVWTEVYSNSAKRWLHCDPCENTCDKPLMYEQGWGKKLSLIIASSRDEIVDVTWRYTNKSDEVLARRKAICREDWLSGKLTEMRKLRRHGLSADRCKLVERRWTRELVEFISPKSTLSNNYSGRTTGSLEWRKARGELGESKLEASKNVITPSLREHNSKLIEIKYFSTTDHYTRKFHLNSNGWQSFAYLHQNIERKVENDWKMSYLARVPTTTNGHISWKIDLGKSAETFAIKQVAVFVKSTIFQSGIVKLLMCTEKSSCVVKSNETNVFNKEVSGASTFSLHAFLSGGDGNNAWQHTQLFRESLDSSNFQMHIVVELLEKCQ